MNEDELKSMLEQHRLWLDSNGGKRADLRYADLQYANLRGVDLQRADMRDANLRYANLRGADLQYADMQEANLRGANLRYANLRDANLRGANLRSANLDYSCLPLWCGSKGMIVDRRIAAQIAAHFCVLDCDDADYRAARTAILEFCNFLILDTLLSNLPLKNVDITLEYIAFDISERFLSSLNLLSTYDCITYSVIFKA